MNFMNESQMVEDKLDMIYHKDEFPVACSRLTLTNSEGFALVAVELGRIGFYDHFIELLEKNELSFEAVSSVMKILG